VGGPGGGKLLAAQDEQSGARDDIDEAHEQPNWQRDSVQEEEDYGAGGEQHPGENADLAALAAT
jgi:hypothetical protein